MEATKKQASYKPEMDSQIPKANLRLPRGNTGGVINQEIARYDI